MITRYHPDNAPNHAEWLAMDDDEKIYLVADYHKRARINLPNRNLHAVFHVIVENQIAMDETVAVRENLERLMSEGLERHDAIHAIGSIVAKQMHKSVTTCTPADNKAYFNRLRQLNAVTWRRSAQTAK